MLFANYVYKTLCALRKDPEINKKKVVIYMDNASIHKGSMVYEVARDLKVDILLAAQYSPFLNPVEALFGHLKRKVRELPRRPRRDELAVVI